jgi:hypothetical protein
MHYRNAEVAASWREYSSERPTRNHHIAVRALSGPADRETHDGVSMSSSSLVELSADALNEHEMRATRFLFASSERVGRARARRTVASATPIRFRWPPENWCG